MSATAERTSPAQSATAIQPVEGELIPPGSTPHGPASLPALPRRGGWSRGRIAALVLGLLLLGGGAAAAYQWWRAQQAALPPGFSVANGRLEAEQIDISTKFAGRVAELLVNEGDQVKAGQVVARMDTRDLEANLRRTAAQARASERKVEEATAGLEQQKTQLALAQAEFGRTSTLVQRGYATQELFDQRRQALEAAQAALNAATARVGQAERALEAAQHEVEYLKVNIAENTLVAPRDGRIQYRIANLGEVLAAGGKVFTMLDVSDVYMDIFLPAGDAGRTRFGTEGRIVLDSYPAAAIPAHVSFIATQAQFTPKTVETRAEREKLMFRVKLRVDADILKGREAEVRSGLPGVGYVKLDPKAEWPDRLKGIGPR